MLTIFVLSFVCLWTNVAFVAQCLPTTVCVADANEKLFNNDDDDDDDESYFRINWGGYVSASQKKQINALLCRFFKCCFTSRLWELIVYCMK